MPIELVPVDADLQLVRQAARYKASGKLAYAAAFAAALAKLRGAELVTGDADFTAVEGEIKIGWLKQAVPSTNLASTCLFAPPPAPP